MRTLHPSDNQCLLVGMGGTFANLTRDTDLYRVRTVPTLADIFTFLLLGNRKLLSV